MAEEQVQPTADSNAPDTTGSAVFLSLDSLGIGSVHLGFGIFLASFATWIGIVILGLAAVSIWIGNLL